MSLVHPAIQSGSSGNNSSPLLVDGSGNLLVNVNAGGASGGTSSTVGAAYPGTATAAGAKDNAGNLAALNLDASGFLKVNVVAGSGSGLSVTDEAAWTAGTSQFVPSGGAFNDTAAALTTGQQGSDRSTPNRAKHVNLRNNSGTEIGTLSNAVRTDPIGTTAQPVTGTFWQATQPVSGTFWQATQPVSIAATVTASLAPATSGGVSSSKLVSAASTNASSVKASAGQLYSAQVFNTNATSPRYLKLYDKASAPTVGTDTPIATWLIPANGSGFTIALSVGMVFASGIAFALTTGITDADTGAVAASEIVVNLQFK